MEDDVDTDSSEFKALMTKHHGLTRKQIKRIVDGTPNADDIYNTLDREITQADSNLRQEHFYQMSQDLVDTDDPDTFEHAIKYMGLDKYSTFDSAAAKRQPEQLRRLFIRHGIEGRVNETHLPAELKKQIKEKEKNAA